MKNIVMFCGGLVLLISWVTKTFLFDRWNRRLADIRSAKSVFLIYQSNNALFTGITKFAPRDLWDELWEIQNRNYEYGLVHLRDVLSERRRHQLNQKISEKTRKHPYSTMGEHGFRAAEVVVVQEELLKEKARIESYEQRAQIAFWILNLVGSAVVLAGNLVPEE